VCDFFTSELVRPRARDPLSVVLVLPPLPWAEYFCNDRQVASSKVRTHNRDGPAAVAHVTALQLGAVRKSAPLDRLARRVKPVHLVNGWVRTDRVAATFSTGGELLRSTCMGRPHFFSCGPVGVCPPAGHQDRLIADGLSFQSQRGSLQTRPQSLESDRRITSLRLATRPCHDPPLHSVCGVQGTARRCLPFLCPFFPFCLPFFHPFAPGHRFTPAATSIVSTAPASESCRERVPPC
jgi:hypothetical protein